MPRLQRDANLRIEPRQGHAGELTSQPNRSLVLWLTNVSHGVNHFQSGMVSVLYPGIMADLGFGYVQLGVLAALQSLLGSAAQVACGFLVPFARRTRLLGIGNLIVGFGTLLTGLVGSYTAFVGARSLTSIGNGGQHPVAASLLSGYFPSNRGTILALNHSLANVGSLLAPLLAGVLLLAIGWRQIFVLVAFASLAMGVVYFLVREGRPRSEGEPDSVHARLARGGASYRRVLRNRNMLVISLVMMVGAAGRDAGVTETYLGPHLINDLAMSAAVAGLALSVLQIGAIAGPIGLGWLSDRLSRKGVIQASLLLSAGATWWLANQDAYLPILLLNLVIYGAVSYSRVSLTQALVADSLTDADRDAAFSLYYFIGFISGPIWGLLTGVIMETAGFSVAFSVLGFSYLAGMLLMFLVEDPRSRGYRSLEES
jgi:MFS family permease